MPRIFYRFAHETDDAFKTVDIQGAEVPLGDFKVLVAQSTGLEREFARTIDLRVFSIDDDEEFTDDDHLLSAGIRLIVQRVAWHAKEVLSHISENNIGQDFAISTPIRRLLPEELLCPKCGKILNQPLIVHCANSCGGSVCIECYSEGECPLGCGSPVKAVFLNKLVSAIISKVDLSEFKSNMVVKEPTSAESILVPPIVSQQLLLQQQQQQPVQQQLQQQQQQQSYSLNGPPEDLPCPFSSLESICGLFPVLSLQDFQRVCRYQNAVVEFSSTCLRK